MTKNYYKTISKNKRIRVFNRDKFVCHYCGVKCFLWNHEPYVTTPDNTATIEHIYPKSDIRSLLTGNNIRFVTTACRKCNKEKGEIDGLVFSDDAYVLDNNLIFDLLKGDYSKIKIS